MLAEQIQQDAFFTVKTLFPGKEAVESRAFCDLSVGRGTLK